MHGQRVVVTLRPHPGRHQCVDRAPVDIEGVRKTGLPIRGVEDDFGALESEGIHAIHPPKDS
jgi:hypothetical protein